MYIFHGTELKAFPVSLGHRTTLGKGSSMHPLCPQHLAHILEEALITVKMSACYGLSIHGILSS